MSGITIDRAMIIDLPTGRMYVRARNNSGGSVTVGDVVILDTSVSTDVAFTTTTTGDDAKVLGMCAQAIANGDEGLVQVYGLTDGSVLKVNGTTAIAAGDLLSTYTTAKIGQKATTGKAGSFAFALAAYNVADSNGLIKAFIDSFGASRQDASATVTYGTAGQMAADGIVVANAAGSTAAVARIDHAHTHTNDTPALVLGTTNAVGTVGKPLTVDATVAVFDTTVPSTIQSGASAAAGSAAFAARRDHTHAIVNDAPADGSSLASANAAGTSSGFSRGDHAHKAVAKNDVDIIFGTTDAAGTAARMEYDTAETVDALKLGLDETSRRLIISDYGDMGTDSTLTAAANPEIVLLDATAAKFFRFRTDTTGAILDVSTGDNYTIRVAGTTEYTIDAAALTLASGNNLKFGGNDKVVDTNGNELIELISTAAAVNHIQVTNKATGTNVELSAAGTGTDINAGITLMAKGTFTPGTASQGAIVIDNAVDPVALQFSGARDSYTTNLIVDVVGNELLVFNAVTNAVNQLGIASNSTGNPVSLTTIGNDANIGINIAPKGTGAVLINNDTDPVDLRLMGAAGALNKNIITDVNGNELVELFATASAVNHVLIKTGATGTGPEITSAVTGADANTDLRVGTNGTGVVDVRYAVTALGTGANATLGATGGSGPLTPGQNSWLQVKVNGTASFIPIWR